MDSFDSLPVTPDHEQTAQEILSRIRIVFPEYSVMDRIFYDRYDAANDRDGKGKILAFYTERGKGVDTPSLLFIFRESGFVINYYNTPEPTTPYTIRNRGNSLYGRYVGQRKEQRWTLDQLDFALERAKIHKEGILIDSAFRSQIAGWSEQEKRYVTMGERLDKYKKGHTAQEVTWNTLARMPEKAAELAIARISQHPEYVYFNGIPTTSDEVCLQIREGTAAGRQAIQRELNSIESYETLLRDHTLLALT